ncbi:unnamed protein product [Kuraishia capsulata CBS 1993]|uniref:Uncharacterized protein n=1 Tax=Kuraishia capsulata CBS 1993 TaxID=1382522 RepID=W6MT31_9ASCO|nr:uncharacterized protein KUCA_T00005505001 [Kuraishia capsulata CBS 1993]CDK29513.1 unnamed protein product [Kuraishia capsulata CBS 1993]
MPTNSSSLLPAGMYTPIPTFFKGPLGKELDLDSQTKHAKFLYQSGINGLVVAGSLGESPHMTRKERASLVKALREAVPDPEFKIIAGAPPSSIEDAIEETKAAKEAGADFSILLVQGYFGSLISQEGIVEYFTAVADGAALPFLIYNYPGTCNNVEISAESYEQLASHPNIAGCKLTHFNLALYTLLGKVSRRKDVNFTLLTGLGQVLIPAMSVGIHGAIDGMSGIFPKVMVKLHNLCKEGKFEEALELQCQVTKADDMIGALNMNGVKHALNSLYGFGGDYLTGRPPMSKPVGAAYSPFETSMNELSVIEKAL